MKQPKIEYDETQKCKCNKPMPIMPYYCDDCGRSSTKGKKIEIVNLGKKKLPSGIVVE